MRRTLNLAKENLSELAPAELDAVVGAAPWTPGCHIFIELAEKLNELTVECGR